MENVFWTQFAKICEKSGTNPTRACKEAGVATGGITGQQAVVCTTALQTLLVGRRVV